MTSGSRDVAQPPATLRRFCSFIDDATKEAIQEHGEDRWPEVVLAALEHVSCDGELKSGRVMDQAFSLASRMINVGYSLRGHPMEQRFIDMLYRIVTSDRWFSEDPPNHRWACSLFAGHSNKDRSEMWHFASPRGRRPTVPWRPMYDFVERNIVTPRSALVNNSGYMNRRNNIISLTRNVSLEARVLYAPEAFVEIWSELRHCLDVHTHFGWPVLNFYLPTNRLFGSDPLFPCSDSLFEAQVATVREMLGCAVGTAHWSSSSGTPNFGMLRIVRRLWMAYLQANPQNEERQATLDKLFDRNVIVPFIFHIAFLSLRIPIATEEEHQRQANVDDDKLYFGERSTVRSEAAETLVAFVTNDLDDAFWPLFEQLCRITEVHANPGKTRRSSYATSFLASFADKLARRVKGQLVPYARIHPMHKLNAATLARVTATLRPLAARAAFGSHSSHATIMYGAAAFFYPVRELAEEVVSMAKLGLSSSHESHQITRSVEILARVVGQLWCGKLLRCDDRFDRSGVLDNVPPNEAQLVLRSAMPELMPQLLLGLDANDISKVTPCSVAIFRLLAVCASSGVKCDQDVLGMDPCEYAGGVMERTVKIINALPKITRTSRKAATPVATALAGLSGVVLERLVDAGAAESIVRATNEHMAHVVPETTPLFRAFLLAVGSSCGDDVNGPLLESFLSRSDPTRHKEGSAMDQTILAATLILCSSSDLVLSKVPLIQATIAAWREHGEKKDGRGRSWLRCTQMLGKLVRSTVAALSADSLSVIADDSADCILVASNRQRIAVKPPTDAAHAAARDLLRDSLAAPEKVLEEYAEGTGLHTAVEGERLVQALQLSRYLYAGAARNYHRPLPAMEPKFRPFAAAESEAEWQMGDDGRPWDRVWYRAPVAVAPSGRRPSEPLGRSIADVTRLMLKVATRLVDHMELKSPIDAMSIKSVKIVLKVFRVCMGRKSTKSTKLSTMYDELSSALSETAITPDGFHYPRAYFLARAHVNRGTRLSMGPAPVDDDHLELASSLLRIVGRCSVAASNEVRAPAQDLFTASVDRLVEIVGTKPAFPLMQERARPFDDEPSQFVKRNDHELTGLFWLATDALRLLWNNDKFATLALSMARTLMRAPEFSKPSNEQRRNAFFNSLRSSLLTISARSSTANHVINAMHEFAAESKAATITVTRYFTVLEGATPDPDSMHSRGTADAINALITRTLPLALQHSSDLSGTTTEAPQSLMTIMMLAVPRRRKTRVMTNTLDARGRIVIDGVTYEVAKNHLKARLFQAKTEKVLEVDPNDELDNATLAPLPTRAREIGDAVWNASIATDPDSDSVVPSKWLHDFFELAVSTQVETFSADQALIWRCLMQAAAQATVNGGDRSRPTKLIAEFAVQNMIAAANGEQVREQVHRCVAALNAFYGVLRGSKTLQPSHPVRRGLYDSLCDIIRMACAQVNVPSEVLDAVEDGLTGVIKAIHPTEVGRIATLLADIALEVVEGNSQQCVRAITLLASLGLLGLNGDQYPQILRAMARVIDVVHRCNHQMRVAIISLVYRFFYVVALLDPDWLVTEAGRPFLAGTDACPNGNIVNVDPSELPAVFEMRQKVWETITQPLQRIPESEDGQEVAVSKETTTVAKVFAASLSGSQAVVSQGHERETVSLLLRAAAISVKDGDDLRSLLGDAIWTVAFQRHTAQGAMAIAERAVEELEKDSANRRAKVHAATLARIVTYLNQFQWPSQAAHEAFGLRLLDACVKNFDNTYRPLREQLTSTFAVFCRVLPRGAVKRFAIRCNKAVGDTTGAHAVTKSAAIIASCVIATSFPDSVPDFMPRLLVRLAKWSYLLPKDFTSAATHADTMRAVREALQTWWKTHRDEWHYRHSDAFSSDQRETLMDHFQGQSYYV